MQTKFDEAKIKSSRHTALPTRPNCEITGTATAVYFTAINVNRKSAAVRTLPREIYRLHSELRATEITLDNGSMSSRLLQHLIFCVSCLPFSVTKIQRTRVIPFAYAR